MTSAENRSYYLWAILFLLVGAAVRIGRYFLDFPLWGDEVFVCQNFWDRDYRTILNQLENGQICPPAFLWCQLAAFRTLGSSELAMRFVPLAAGLLALVLFWKLARSILEPMPAMFAVALLSMATWPIGMATTAKPYSFDLLAAVGLQLAAVRWWQKPEAKGRLIVLVFLFPLAMFTSYPAAFVTGGISLALLPLAWRQPGLWGKGLFALANVLMFAAFALALQVGKEQFEGSEVPTIKNFLLDYWKDGFPTYEKKWWEFPLWFAEAHTGRMMAYPAGDAYFGSTATFLVFCVGIYRWGKDKKFTLLTLFLAPFALNLIAAFLLKFPYAACGRITQHLAPAVCLIAASGLSHLLEWRHPNPVTRRKVAGAIAILFGMVGVGMLVFGIVKPYHDDEAKWMRDIPRAMAKDRQDRGDSFFVLGKETDTPNVLRYYLRRENAQWLGESRKVPWPANNDMTRAWVVDVWVGNKEEDKYQPRPKIEVPFRESEKRVYVLQPDPDRGDYFYFCTVTIYGTKE